MIPTGGDFQQALDDLFDDALKSGQPFVVVKVNEFHDEVVVCYRLPRGHH